MVILLTIIYVIIPINIFIFTFRIAKLPMKLQLGKHTGVELLLYGIVLPMIPFIFSHFPIYEWNLFDGYLSPLIRILGIEKAEHYSIGIVWLQELKYPIILHYITCILLALHIAKYCRNNPREFSKALKFFDLADDNIYYYLMKREEYTYFVDIKCVGSDSIYYGELDLENENNFNFKNGEIKLKDVKKIDKPNLGQSSSTMIHNDEERNFSKQEGIFKNMAFNKRNIENINYEIFKERTRDEKIKLESKDEA